MIPRPLPPPKADTDLYAAYAIERVAGEILHVALEDRPLADALQRALACALSLPWLDGGRGRVLVADPDGGAPLVVEAESGVSGPSTGPCEPRPSGGSPCVRAADLVEPQAWLHRDERGERCCAAGVEDHGHCCLPLRDRNEQIGVLCLCVPPSFATSDGALARLGMVADALALVIGRDRASRARDQLLRQYLHAQKLEAVGRLAGGVAHDFNNLLSVISTCAILVKDDMASEDPARADLDEIHEMVTRAAALTRQLLAFSRREVNDPVALVVDEAVGDMAKMLGRILGETHPLAIDAGSGDAVAVIDHGLFEQAVVNLVVNARDAMPDGGPISIATRAVHGDAGDRVAVTVTDRGCGIADDVIDHIFEPFFTTKERGAGTGLGLSTTYGIVHQAGGTITVDSRVGGGTTFTILLPSANNAVNAAPEAPCRSPSLAGARILLVEDDDRVRAGVRRLLVRAGAAVVEASGAREAEQVSTGHGGEIDVLVTDLVMPERDGAALATALLAERPSMGVVLMTGYADDVLARYPGIGARCELVRKPLSDGRLLAAVQTAWRSRAE